MVIEKDCGFVQRYVPADWWDPNLDHGPCQYYWDEEKDMWMTEPTFRQRSGTG